MAWPRSHNEPNIATSRRVACPIILLEMIHEAVIRVVPASASIGFELFDVNCTVCDHCEDDLSSPLCPALGAADAALGGYYDARSKENDIPLSWRSCCTVRRAARSHVRAWCGSTRSLSGWTSSTASCTRQDLCLVVGTSSTVRWDVDLCAQY
ncbi:hypothetical protein B0H21DRAFT_159284 [Amylocystis lapponica]|nr:hypothetical protein B0H21DRAFT_159284 [Amylocystis lapponica]